MSPARTEYNTYKMYPITPSRSHSSYCKRVSELPVLCRLAHLWSPSYKIRLLYHSCFWNTHPRGNFTLRCSSGHSDLVPLTSSLVLLYSYLPSPSGPVRFGHIPQNENKILLCLLTTNQNSRLHCTRSPEVHKSPSETDNKLYPSFV